MVEVRVVLVAGGVSFLFLEGIRVILRKFFFGYGVGSGLEKFLVLDLFVVSSFVWL